MQKVVNSFGTIITFYSYKGGTGRSMAVANIACLLGLRVDRGSRVLMVDWDLESPGLHGYFANPGFGRESLQPGLIEYFSALGELVASEQSVYSCLAEPGGRNLLDSKVPLGNYVLKDVAENVDLMKAGAVGGPEYVGLVNDFDWVHLHDEFPLLLDAFQELLAERWEYVLIDSRTGLTDVGGICTSVLPEKLVTVFTPNRQSLDGVLGIIPEVIEFRRRSNDFRPLAVFPLPSRIDLDEELLRRRWREDYQREMEEVFERAYKLDAVDLSPYFDEVQIPQKGYYAYGEGIAVLEEKRREVLSLSRAYENFCVRLVGQDRAWGEVDKAVEEVDWSKRQTARVYVLAFILVELGAGGLLFANGFFNTATSAGSVSACVMNAISGASGISLVRVVRAYRDRNLGRRMVRRTLFHVTAGAALGLLFGAVRLGFKDLDFDWDTTAVCLMLGALSDVLGRWAIRAVDLLMTRQRTIVGRL